MASSIFISEKMLLLQNPIVRHVIQLKILDSENTWGISLFWYTIHTNGRVWMCGHLQHHIFNWYSRWVTLCSEARYYFSTLYWWYILIYNQSRVVHDLCKVVDFVLSIEWEGNWCRGECSNKHVFLLQASESKPYVNVKVYR